MADTSRRTAGRNWRAQGDLVAGEAFDRAWIRAGNPGPSPPRGAILSQLVKALDRHVRTILLPWPPGNDGRLVASHIRMWLCEGGSPVVLVGGWRVHNDLMASLEILPQGVLVTLGPAVSFQIPATAAVQQDDPPTPLFASPFSVHLDSWAVEAHQDVHAELRFNPGDPGAGFGARYLQTSNGWWYSWRNYVPLHDATSLYPLQDLDDDVLYDP